MWSHTSPTLRCASKVWSNILARNTFKQKLLKDKNSYMYSLTGKVILSLTNVLRFEIISDITSYYPKHN